MLATLISSLPVERQVQVGEGERRTAEPRVKKHHLYDRRTIMRRARRALVRQLLTQHFTLVAGVSVRTSYLQTAAALISLHDGDQMIPRLSY